MRREVPIRIVLSEIRSRISVIYNNNINKVWFLVNSLHNLG